MTSTPRIGTITLELSKESIDAWEFSVSIGGHEHIVSLQKKYKKQLVGERISARELVFRSTLFLLEREPQEAILKEFDIQDITTYFPDYEERIQKAL